MSVLTAVTKLLLLAPLAHPSGCCTVLVHVKDDHYVLAYRRDAKTPAEIVIQRIQWAGRPALKEFKRNSGGYFCHTVITRDGWILTIGGRDSPTINRELERLGQRIVERGRIERGDVRRAMELLRENRWGHFVVKAPDGTVGIAVYDYRVSAGRLERFRLREGEYVKVTNNPYYYAVGRYREYDGDPVTAAIKVAGRDTYGIHRRDVITYSLEPSGRGLRIRVWASYDGGAMVGGAPGAPDPVNFLGRRVPADQLPKIPARRELGTVTLERERPKARSSSGGWSALATALAVGVPLAVGGLAAGRWVRGRRSGDESGDRGEGKGGRRG